MPPSSAEARAAADGPDAVALAIAGGSAVARAAAGRVARHRDHVAVVAVATVLSLASLSAFGLTPKAAVAMFFVSVLTVLARIDLRERVLPNRIVVPAAAIVAVAQSAIFPDRAVEWIGAAALASLVLLLPLLVYPSGMGMGDVKLGLLLGAGLGLPVISAIALGFVLVLPVALFLIARGGASARKTAIPFGPFLAAGAVIVLFGGALH